MENTSTLEDKLNNQSLYLQEKNKMEKIEDGSFICNGCSDKCKLTVENQNLYFEKECALDNVDKWERLE